MALHDYRCRPVFDGGCPRKTTVCTGKFVPVEASAVIDDEGTRDGASAANGGSPTAIGETPLFKGSSDTSSPMVIPAATATAPKEKTAKSQSDAAPPIRRGVGRNAPSTSPKALFAAANPAVSAD